MSVSLPNGWMRPPPPTRRRPSTSDSNCPADDLELLAGKPFRGVNLWPDLPGWRARVLAYYDACMTLQLDIHRGFALDLGLPEDFFADKMDRPDRHAAAAALPGRQAGPRRGT